LKTNDNTEIESFQSSSVKTHRQNGVSGTMSRVYRVKNRPPASANVCAVFDAGRSFAKLSLVTAAGTVLHESRTRTPSLHTGDYGALDTDALFTWLLAELKVLSGRFAIDRIMPVAHGAACAFLDADGALVQPIHDYESAIPQDICEAYARIRPAFSETLSPPLPNGLNLGAQLFWHARRDPQMFARVRWLLPYPQYWAWRLSGALTCEITSLGCHSDLWCPERADFSSLAYVEGWAQRFAPLRSAWDTAGRLQPQIAAGTGLSPDVRVCVGLHDTNAALAAAHQGWDGEAPALLSTGTWFIAMAPGAPLTQLQAERDCLGAVDVFGRPVACARFMGGRAYELIAGSAPPAVDPGLLRALMRDAALALPSFLDAGGPYPRHHGEIRGLRRDTPRTRAALGLLYQALLSHTCLDLIQSGRPLLIEGMAARNPVLCGLIAALHDGPVFVNTDVSGVTLGAAALAFRDEAKPPRLAYRRCEPLLAEEMRIYSRLWTAAVDQAVAA
jgi:sugar (pentulose or hexulose) kinase